MSWVHIPSVSLSERFSGGDLMVKEVSGKGLRIYTKGETRDVTDSFDSCSLNQESQNQIMKFFPDKPLSWNYLGDTQERLNRGILECNPLNRNWVPTFDNPHLSLEPVSSILESRRNVCVQDSGDGNENSCHMDYCNGNTSNHLECKILVLENGSFGFPLECPSSGKPFIPLEDSIDSIHSCRRLHRYLDKQHSQNWWNMKKSSENVKMTMIYQ